MRCEFAYVRLCSNVSDLILLSLSDSTFVARQAASNIAVTVTTGRHLDNTNLLHGSSMA